jgi:hypothetical protein
LKPLALVFVPVFFHDCLPLPKDIKDDKPGRAADVRICVCCNKDV